MLRVIGRGGMGTVYEAVHVQLGRKVAVKVLARGLLDEPEAIEMFRREARTTSRLGNPHIVDVTDLTVLPDGRLMFAMELLDGPTLREELDRGVLPAARVIGILRQLCKGLSAAHGASVVHRDIKPENIALVRGAEGRPDAVKILDFGIAEIEGRADPSGRLAGTPAYLAPELILTRLGDHRVDMYAVGCVAYELLTGNPPFGHAEALHHHLETKPGPLRARAKHAVPRALEQVVLRCLAKDPAERFADMDDLEAALCEAQIAAGIRTAWDDLPLPDKIDPKRRERLRRRMPGRTPPTTRRWTGAAAVVAIALASAVGWTASRPRAAALRVGVAPRFQLLPTTAAERDPPPEPAPRSPTVAVVPLPTPLESRDEPAPRAKSKRHLRSSSSTRPKTAERPASTPDREPERSEDIFLPTRRDRHRTSRVEFQ